MRPPTHFLSTPTLNILFLLPTLLLLLLPYRADSLLPTPKTLKETNHQQLVRKMPDSLEKPVIFFFQSPVDQLLDNQSLNLSAAWNGVPLVNDSTTTIPSGSGTLSWSYTPNPSHIWQTGGSSPDSLDDALRSAVITLDLYKGIAGDSSLIYSATISSSTSGSVELTLNSSGPYVLAVSATYPSDTYPPGKSPDDLCATNPFFCTVPTYSLTDFHDVLSAGYPYEETPTAPDRYRPAAYGIFATSLLVTTQPPKAKSSNVLFIPGTLISRLYTRNANGSERELWEPRSNLDVGMLVMNPDGTSKNTIYTRDLVDRLYGNSSLYGTAVQKALGSAANVYGPFESFMDSLVTNNTITTWQSYPYDWRYDVEDIVANGTLVGNATSTPTRIYLQDVVRSLASSSPTGKVTIVAHSNGGLLAKALAQNLEKSHESSLLDRLVLIGTPQFGTPKTVVDMLHGSEFTQLGGLVMYGNSVRAAEATMPGVYDLLPSASYFRAVSGPVVSFDTKQPANLYRNALGATITSPSILSDFLTDTHHLDSSAGLRNDIKTPLALSTKLVAKSQATHALIDTWIPPAEINFITLTGWGQDTPYMNSYTGTSGLSCDRTNFFVFVACTLLPQLHSTVMNSLDGDDTVIAESALGLSSNNWYFNLLQLEKDGGGIVLHRNLLTALTVQSSIKNILLGLAPDDPYLTQQKPSSLSEDKTIISAHSPVNILASDTEGNETGTVSVTGLSDMYFEKQDIPGSSIQIVGDEKYISLPSSASYSLSLHGYDAGITTIDVQSVISGNASTTSEFADIPTTPNTTATFTVGPGASTSDTIQVFIQGTGTSTTIASNARATSTDPLYRPERFLFRLWLATLTPWMRHIVRSLPHTTLMRRLLIDLQL